MLDIVQEILVYSPTPNPKQTNKQTNKQTKQQQQQRQKETNRDEAAQGHSSMVRAICFSLQTIDFFFHSCASRNE